MLRENNNHTECLVIKLNDETISKKQIEKKTIRGKQYTNIWMLFSDRELIQSKNVQLIFYATFNICTAVKSNGSKMIYGTLHLFSSSKTPLHVLCFDTRKPNGSMC